MSSNFGTGPTEGLDFVKGGGAAPYPAPPDIQAQISQSLADTPSKPQCVTEPGGSGGLTGQTTIPTTGAAVLVKVRNECRMAIKITKLDANDVFLGFSPSVSSINGDLLSGAKGSFVIIPSILDIYAACATGVTANISFMEITI